MWNGKRSAFTLTFGYSLDQENIDARGIAGIHYNAPPCKDSQIPFCKNGRSNVGPFHNMTTDPDVLWQGVYLAKSFQNPPE